VTVSAALPAASIGLRLEDATLLGPIDVAGVFSSEKQP